MAPVIVGKDLSEISKTCAWSTLMLITGHCFLKRKHFRAQRESLKQFSLRQHSVKNHNQISQMESWGMRWTCHDCHSSIGCLQLLHAKDFSCYWFWWSRLMDTSPRPISTQLGRFLDTAATIATWWFFKVGQFLIWLEMIRLDCSCAGLRTADETSAVGRTTAAPLVEQQHNSVYTTAQEIRQRKYIKDALTSFNPHMGIQFIHFLRWLRIRFRKCQMPNTSS